jgi:hypothetical protein
VPDRDDGCEVSGNDPTVIGLRLAVVIVEEVGVLPEGVIDGDAVRRNDIGGRLDDKGRLLGVALRVEPGMLPGCIDISRVMGDDR